MEKKDEIKKGIEETLTKEFSELNFPPEFRAEMEKYIRDEPKRGYNIEDLHTLISETAALRQEPPERVTREVYYMVVGQLLTLKYNAEHTDK